MRDNYWTTIAFTALPPGWFNYYRNDDGTFWADPCPGVVMQEHVVAGEPETRTVAATLEEGEIVAAADRYIYDGSYKAASYQATTTAAQWAQWDAEEAEVVVT